MENDIAITSEGGVCTFLAPKTLSLIALTCARFSRLHPIRRIGELQQWHLRPSLSQYFLYALEISVVLRWLKGNFVL